MKLILVDSGYRWDMHREAREKLRAVTRVGHKKHWDCVIQGTWWDLYRFSYMELRNYAVLLWTGSDAELMMIKLADPANLIIDAMDIEDTFAELEHLVDCDSKQSRKNSVSWSWFQSYQNSTTAPPLFKKLLDMSFKGPVT